MANTYVSSVLPQNKARPTTPVDAASNLFIGLAIVALLYFGREIFVPVVIALLLSFLLAPLVRLLRRWHAGHSGAVVASVALAFFLIFGMGAVMTQQMSQLAENLPQYQQTISAKIQSLQRAALSPGILSRLSHMLGELHHQISTPAAPGVNNTPGQTASQEAQQKPIPVEIEQPPLRPIEIIRTIVGPLLPPLATAGLVIVFVIFMLLFRADLRGRFVRLAGAQDLGRTSEAMDDAGRRLSRYFLTQTGINALFGVIIGTGLWLIGIPNPVLWGTVAAVMRFVPYIGAFIAAAFPAALAIAVDPGWSMLLWTAGLFLVVEPVLGQFVEPMLYGHNTGLSPVAVVVAAAFWTWLWGPIGLILSTPVTLCLVVLGRHVERLEFLDIILGDQPALNPEQTFFQRMLAGDPDEAADQAERYMKKRSLRDFYDEVAIPALLLARGDAERGALDHEQLRRIKETVEGLVDNLSDHEDVVSRVKGNHEDADDSSEPAGSPEIESEETPERSLPVVINESLKSDWRGEKPVLCIGARDALDEATAVVIAQLLEKHNLGARVEPSAAASTSSIFRLDSAHVAMVCVSCLGRGSPVHLRFLLRRLRRKLPRAVILVGFWGTEPDATTQEDFHETTGADRYARSLHEALEFCIEAAQDPVAAPDVRPSGADLTFATHLAANA